MFHIVGMWHSATTMLLVAVCTWLSAKNQSQPNSSCTTRLSVGQQSSMAHNRNLCEGQWSVLTPLEAFQTSMNSGKCKPVSAENNLHNESPQIVLEIIVIVCPSNAQHPTAVQRLSFSAISDALTQSVPPPLCTKPPACSDSVCETSVK